MSRNCCNNCSNVSCDKVVDCLNRQWTRFVDDKSNDLVNFCESTAKCINAQFLNISLSQPTTLTYFDDAITAYLKTLTGYSTTSTLVLTTVLDVLQWTPGGGGGGSGTVTSVVSGSGMNFPTFTTTGSIIMGVPSSVTLSSTNSLTSTSHTHAFTPGGTSGQYIRGDGTLASFPSIPGGTVTSFIFTDGNGFDGTVTNPTTTPTLSLTTTVANTKFMYSSGGAITGTDITSGVNIGVTMSWNPSGSAGNPGGVSGLVQLVSPGWTDEIGYSYAGGDFGYVRNQVANTYISGATPIAAASGFQAVNTINGTIGQFYLGLPGNVFMNDGLMVRSTGAGGVRVSADTGLVTFAVSANGANEYARFTGTSTRRFGILTGSTVDTTLHVVGDLKFVTGNQGAGKILTSDANGVADWATASGGGSGVTTMAAIGAVPNANGASISGVTLTLQPADASFGGAITTVSQTFAGVKTFNLDIVISGVQFGIGGGGFTDNVRAGLNALNANTTGTRNTAIGYNALVNNTTGYYTTAIGYEAARGQTTGNLNIAIGVASLYTNQTGTDNIAIGSNALLNNTNSFNVAIGSGALQQNQSTGNLNVAIGYVALNQNTTGVGNLGIGYQTLYDVTTGGSNTAYGFNTGRGITTGSGNLVFGPSVTGLASGLTNNIILASGGGIKAQHDGTNWTLTDRVNTTAQTLTSANTTQTTTTSASVLGLNSLTTGTGLYMESSTLSSGKMAQIVVTGTAGLDNQTGLSISLTGVNTTAAQRTYALDVSNTHSGTTSVNVAARFTATGGASQNIAALFTGRCGFAGITTPFFDIDVGNGSIGAGSLYAGPSTGGTNGNFMTGNTSALTSNVNAMYQILGSSSISGRIFIGGNGATAISAGLPYATTWIGAATVPEASSGNHPLIASLVLIPPAITVGAATATDGATLYIDGPTTGTVSGTNASIQVRTGNVEFRNGNLSLGTAGNKLSIATGSNASVGVSGAMTAGTITISTTAVTAASKIFLTNAAPAGTIGVLSVGTIVAATSFVINSSSALDTSTVNWWIVN